MPVARISVDVGLAHLDRPFDYLVPARLDADARPGVRVRVRFAGQLVDGYLPEFEARLPYDRARASALLKEAGYGEGFDVTLDCVNVAYRAAVCQAVAGMLAQVGIRVAFQPYPTATFFPRLTQATSSFFEFGWTPTPDAWGTLNAIVRSFSADGTTLPLPIPAAQVTSSSADVDGVPATVVTSRDGTMAGVVWVDDGIVNAVAGTMSADEVLSVARGLG